MSKTGGSSGKAAKAPKQRVVFQFLSYSDLTEYTKFNKYQQPFEGPTKWSVKKYLSRDIAKKTARLELRVKKWVERKGKITASLLRRFDSLPFEGPRFWQSRKSHKENVREILLEFLSDGCMFGAGNGIGVPTDYEFSGQTSGRIRILNPPINIRELVAEAVAWKARRALGLLWTLQDQGNSHAFLQSAQIVMPRVKPINDKADKDPKILGGYPARLPSWPIEKSPHPNFNSDHEAFFKKFHVGRDFLPTISNEKRWTPDDTLGRWALHLCQRIEAYPVGKHSLSWERKMLKLRPFSSKNWKAWWAAAERLLHHEFIDVVDIPELNQTVKGVKDRKSPGLIRRQIIKSLKKKFKSMAGENKFDSATRRSSEQASRR